MSVTENIQKTNMFRVIYLALCFMALFTAYCAAQNLVAQVYSQLGYGKLGQVCLFCIFVFQGTTSAIAAHFKKNISNKTSMIVGAAGLSSIVFAGVLTTFCGKYEVDGGLCNPTFVLAFNVLCACSVGAGSAFLWLSQATYVNECSDDSTRGTFNGMFWSIFQSAQILAGCLATFLLGSTDQFTFYCILVIFSLAALVMKSFVQPPVSYSTTTTTAEADNETFSQAMGRFKDALADSRHYFLFLGKFFSGVSIGCYINFLGAAVVSTVDSDNVNVINQSIGLVLTVLAVGEVAAGLSMGKLADKYDKLKLFTTTLIINEAALLFTLLACLFKSYTFAIICGLLWGYGDTAINTMINVTIGSFFNGKVELFSAYRFFQAYGMVFSAVVCILVPKEYPILFIILIAGAQLGLHTLYHKYLPRQSSKSQEYLLAEEKKLMFELKNV